MSDEPPSPKTWPEATALVVLRVLERGGIGATILIVALYSGAINRLLGIVKDLLAEGVGHFWVAVVASLLALALIALGRRQSLTVRQLADRNRKLCEHNEQLMRALEQKSPLLLTGPTENAQPRQTGSYDGEGNK